MSFLKHVLGIKEMLIFCSSMWFICCLALSSCSNGISKTERAGEPDIYKTTDQNEDMNNAIRMAQDKILLFDSALTAEDTSLSGFTVKARFKTPEGHEHIWINDVILINGNYRGTIGNEPEAVEGISLGDTVNVDRKEVTDWMFFHNGMAVGGYTIRAIRDKMKLEERATFDREYGIRFEE